MNLELKKVQQQFLSDDGKVLTYGQVYLVYGELSIPIKCVFKEDRRVLSLLTENFNKGVNK